MKTRRAWARPSAGRGGRALLCATLAALVLALTGQARAGDPYLPYHTVVTPHFRVHYHDGLERQAARVATLAEAAQTTLGRQLAWHPSQLTHILLVDTTDDANGSATGLPYNTIRLFVTAPDDMDPLADYDDWLMELVTHEYTHILHVDHVAGVPAFVNAVLGKTLMPNQIQPRWVLEGLAVAMETEHTTAGRNRSPLFDMMLRADVLEDHFATIDQLSNNPRRWPMGTLWYLYGGRFVEWMLHLYGPDIFGMIAAEYGDDAVGWALNRAVHKVTGRTYTELYAAWHAQLRREYAAVRREVEARGLREGRRLTDHGSTVAYPRFAPRCGDAALPQGSLELFYYADDGQSRPGIRRLVVPTPERASPSRGELVARTAGTLSQVSFDPACGLVFDSAAPSGRRYWLSDLFHLRAGQRAPWGVRGARERWSVGLRARDPDVSPDGRRLAYVTNHAGTTTLRLAELPAEGGLGREQPLVVPREQDQFFTPRFSPDGRYVAYSAWTRGGYRDIYVVEVATGRLRRLTEDRAADRQPTWSPDGRIVYFSSERTGIANIFAFDLASGTLRQVTNVLGGAFMPDVSRDGAWLSYVGYRSTGFDVYLLPLEPATWLDAPPAPSRPAARVVTPIRPWPVEPYFALSSLRPPALALSYGSGTFGQALLASVRGADVVGWHAVSAAVTVETQMSGPAWSASYEYHRLPFALSMSGFSQLVPRGGYHLGEQEVLVQERLTGATSGVRFPLPGENDSQTLALSYTASVHDSVLPVGTRLDPAAKLSHAPFRGLLSTVRLGYGYGSTFASRYAISIEEGVLFGAGLDLAGAATGSEASLTSLNAQLRGYLPLPWAAHHVLEASLSGGIAAGAYPGQGYFYTGGFVDTQPIDAVMNGALQSGFVLRGYAPGRFVGRQYQLANLELRFPLAYAERGLATLPVFLRTLSGTLFADYGGAFDTLDPRRPLGGYHLGLGAEIWIDVTLGWSVPTLLRFGVAKGLDAEAVAGAQTYFALASVF